MSADNTKGPEPSRTAAVLAHLEVEAELRLNELNGVRRFLVERGEPSSCVEWVLNLFAEAQEVLGPMSTIIPENSPAAHASFQDLRRIYERRIHAWSEWALIAWCDLWHATNDVDE
jgi:hypothetical protein